MITFFIHYFGVCDITIGWLETCTDFDFLVIGTSQKICLTLRTDVVKQIGWCM